MKKIAIVAFMAVVLCSGCGKRLDRAKAAVLVSNSAELHRVADRYALFSTGTGKPWCFTAGTDAEVLGYLADNGFLRASEGNAELTDKGRDLVKSITPTHVTRLASSGFCNTEDWFVKIAVPQSVEVTGITFTGDTQAEVDARWQFAPTNSVGDFVAEREKRGKKDYGLRDTTARFVFRRYDDGWRVEPGLATRARPPRAT